VAVWSQRVATLLPVADEVAFLRFGDSTIALTFCNLERAAHERDKYAEAIEALRAAARGRRSEP